MISEGCSACACGIEGACDVLYWPAYTVPGGLVLIALLIILVVLCKKRVIKLPLKTLIGGWVVLVLIFATITWVQTESEGERVRRQAEFCQRADGPLSCEY